MTAESRGEDEDRSEQALDSMLERVQDVQDLRAFSLTRRGDGRFTYELQKPLPDLTRAEARDASNALEELAEFVREEAGGAPDP